VEIERKFLVAELPELDGVESERIEQGYLALADAGGAEVRLRRRGEELTLTVKGGAGEVRVEEEIGLDLGRFESLWPLTEGRRVAKRRHLIHLGAVTAELDVYERELEGLVTVEVEFASERQADRFQAPEWFGREVTGDQRFKNESLATRGRPE
jgi:adenylate cyclase